MNRAYPTPDEAGVRIPRSLRADRFAAGFEHGLAGRKLDRPEYFRESFRMGFRAAKLYLRRLRRQQGLIEFPQKMKFRVCAIWPPKQPTQKRH